MADLPVLPAALVGEIAVAGGMGDITQPWVGELKMPSDRRLWGGQDWGIYDKIRKDDQVKAVMEQRIRALVSRDWDVRAGDDKDPRSVEAAEKLKANLERIGWDRITEKKAWTSFYGYGAAELIWEVRDGLIQWKTIKVRHARRFRLDKNDVWRLITTARPLGDPVPDRKFWFTTTGATNDDQPYGEGLADWLYWPTLFKRNGIRFWNIFLDKFGQPTLKGTYRPGTPTADINKLLQALQAIATNSAVAIPEGTAIELLEAARSGTGSFEELCRYLDAMIAKIILSQTMTTDSASTGLGSNQANVHDDVKLEVVKADADLLSDGFNTGPARWWTDLNYGPDVASPQVWRDCSEPVDLGTEATTDTALKALGWVRDEESFKDTYGDGYVRVPEPAPVVDPPAPPIGYNGGPALDDPDAEDAPADATPPAAPRPRIRKGRDLPASFADTDGGPPDAVDGVVTQLVRDTGYEAIAPMMAPIADAVARADDPDALDAELIAALGQADVDKLTEAFARAGFAVRVAAETGEEA
jgi:phage gp29-like protein